MLVFGFFAKPIVQGQSVSDLQKQKQEKQQKLNEIQKRIGEIQKEIQTRRSAASSLKNQIAILNLEIAETEAKVEETNGKIDATNLEISDVTENIVQTELDIKKQKEILKSLISQINDLDQMSPLEIALENENFTQFLDQLQYATSIQEESQEALSEVKKLKTELEIRQAELKKYKAELDELFDELKLAEAGLEGQRRSKQQVLDQTKNQEANYQKLLAESKSLEEQINKEIYDLEVDLRAKLGNNRIPPRKGILAMPMNGVLTQGYGNTGFTSLGYNFHNGIDIAAAAGTRIYAAADGVVQDVGTGQGAYGNWVTIRHNIGNKGLITLYAHMSSFRVKDGQQVKRGDLVGFEGNTGNTTRLLYGPHRGYHLHFTVFDAASYGVANGTLTKQFGAYRVPFGATYSPFDFL